jgi:hypothetical protein
MIHFNVILSSISESSKWSLFLRYTRALHIPNQELQVRLHLPRFYHNDTLLYCILSF